VENLLRHRGIEPGGVPGVKTVIRSCCPAAEKMGLSAVSFAVLKSRLEFIHAMMAGRVFCPGITAWIS